jgi:hypothetical protein
MPINRRHFELGVDQESEGWMREIHDYLARHQDSAYSYDELLSHIRIRRNPQGLEAADHEADRAKFESALDELVWMAAVGRRKIGDEEYYALVQEFDTHKWEPKGQV